MEGPNQAVVLAGSPLSNFDLRLTTDGGQTWQMLRSGKQGDAVTAMALAPSGLTWFVNRKGEVFTAKSPVGSWTMLSSLKAASQEDFMEAQQIEFSTDTDGWIRDLLCIWHTKDGGNTWEKSLSVLTPEVKGQPSRIFAVDSNVIVSTGTSGQIYRSEDGGHTWKIRTLIDGDGDFKDVWFSDKQNGFVVGFAGKPSVRPLLFATRDGGEMWQEIPIGDQIFPSSVSFVKDEGWLAGSERPTTEMSSKPVLLHTVDGGLHWARVAVNTDDPFFSLVRFADREHGWLVGRDNLYRTDDAGKTWKAVLSLAPIQNSLN
jgi:photosystem II stability/assembly factor-like uncharacterized protein